MDKQVGATEADRVQALRERYPPQPQAQERREQEELRTLRQAVRELSEVVGELAAYLIAVSLQADAGNTAQEPANRERLLALQEAARTVREHVSD